MRLTISLNKILKTLNRIEGKAILRKKYTILHHPLITRNPDNNRI